MRLLALIASAMSCALGASAEAVASESVASKSLSAGCKELPIAPAKRILGANVILTPSGDNSAYDGGNRSICSVAFSGPTTIFITSESAKSFKYQIDYFRRRAADGIDKRFVPVRLGDAGYSLDRYDEHGSFVSHMHVLRVGGRMFNIEHYRTRGSISAAKRLALAKAVVTTARSRS